MTYPPIISPLSADAAMEDPLETERSVLVIGEALIDLVVRHGDSDDQAEAVPGGSPANVALALGRLGVPVELVTWLGDDDFGAKIYEHLKESNVTVASTSRAAASTSRAIARLDGSGAAKYSFLLEWAPAAPIPVPSTTAVLHTGSIGAVLQPGADAVRFAIELARQQALITYDPNVRPQLMGTPEQARAAIEAIASNSDVIKASDEDLEWLYPDRSAEESALAWVTTFGVPLLVMTRGSKGPVAWLGADTKRSVDPAKVKVVDTVGAGDTFMGGLIDALWRRDVRGAAGRAKLAELDGNDLMAILQESAELADIVVQRRGANPPWASELSR